MLRHFLRYRVLIFVLAITSLAIGMVGGLQRLGWSLPYLSSNAVVFHGPLMVCAFLGTVISLERAVAIGKAWAYFAPFAAGLGGLMLILNTSADFAMLMLVISSVIYVTAMIHIYFRQRATHILVLFIGGVSWLIGNLIWFLELPIYLAVLWWVSFLVLTIAGERLELTRFLPPSHLSKHLFLLITFLLLVGASIPVVMTNGLNFVLFSFALGALAVWLLWHDIARKTVKQQGVTRYIAVCLLSGYFWLLVGALIGINANPLTVGASYDAFLHTVFIGFVFSMIFGHAVIIVPAIFKVKISYNKSLYLALFPLHGSLFVRVLGDLLSIVSYKKISGVLTVAALIFFLITNIMEAVRRQSTA